MQRGLFIRHNHISRAQGQSLVASVAYRTRTKLLDEREGKIHDYTRKRGVIEVGLFAPESVLARYEAYEGRALYERISNDYEHKEDQSTRRKQALLAREFIAALPRECDHAQAWDIARAMGESIGQRGLASIVAFHESDAGDGGKNPHLHILILPRKIEADGSFGKRYEALDPRGKRSEREVQMIRKEYLSIVNDRMEDFGIKVNFHLKKEAEEAKTIAAAEARSHKERTERKPQGPDRARGQDRETETPRRPQEETDRFERKLRRWQSWWDKDGKRKRNEAARRDGLDLAARQALRGGAMAARDALTKTEGAVKPSRQRSANATSGVRHGARLSANLHQGARQL